MEIKAVTPDISVADQIGPTDMSLVSTLGYRTVVCNRPDGEAEDQPLFASVQSAAELSGLETHYVPVSTMGPEPKQMADMKRLLREAPKPLLAYCRSGARSAALINAILAANEIR